jgi:hypothetical protein
MKTLIRGYGSPCKFCCVVPRALIVAGFLFALLPSARALIFPGGGTNSGPTYTRLDSWSFSDHTYWSSDKGYMPVSFTNLAFSYLGNGASLVVDSTNPAWLQFNVMETNATNLTVAAGTVMFWFAPGSWSGTNQGGTGPGEYGRLLEVGGYTPDSSFGWWSIYVDNAGANLFFSAQTNDLSSTFTNYLSVPIAWTTNYFHFVVLTYSATNTALYLDGGLVTNGPPVTVYPGPAALANGFFIGSDSNGVLQAHGLFNSVATYGAPLDGGTIQQIYSQQSAVYKINPLNKAMFTLTNATSSPGYTPSGYDVIIGAGVLQLVATGNCGNDANPYLVWFTNITATVSNNGTMNVTFTIEGGYTNYAYDVFATGALESPLTNAIWVWLGQGSPCNTYTVNITSADAFLIMGTPQDSSGYGLTDAYEELILGINPDGPQTDSYGVPYAWYAQNGLSAGSALQDPDLDALLNYQEYFYGTRPQVSEGFSIWVSTPSGSSSIP